VELNEKASMAIDEEVFEKSMDFSTWSILNNELYISASLRKLQHSFNF
jgi:hypothetical protein